MSRGPDAEVAVIEPEPGAQRCRLCGTPRHRRETDDEWVQDVPLVFQAPQVRRLRGPNGLQTFEADEPEWGRRHVACEPVLGWLVEQVAGVSIDGLTEADVRSIVATTSAPLTAADAEYRGRRPFGWVTDTIRAELAAEVDRVHAAKRPKRSTTGRCALCGQGRAKVWTRLRGWTWRDGSTAATCDACTAALAGVDPFEQADVRLVALSLMAGMRRSRMSLPTARMMRLFVEAAGDDDRHGDAAPWTYSRAALDAIRDQAQTSNPHLVLNPIRRRVAEARLGRLYRQAQDQQREADPLSSLW